MTQLPASILVALGLTGCSPRAPVDEAEILASGRAAPVAPAATGATGDTATTAPCLSAPHPTGDTGKLGVCLCACDGGGAAGATLALPAIAALAGRRRSRQEILDDLAERGVLPPELAARLRDR